ncbi:Nucleoside-diphosphate-sugar epimerase [Actinopolyspora xinjiangensis]|uniref:Nucleoside-diphosphate-sugar epimerase n=1 Tax=Actinopolyspora xinjiangensis TaxID=405564 RepID=A0A1H0WM27_9ACTN|nr:NAD(P)-dependent oxidoreductase [Actinopolyspora xinjiangensis]SDP91621.1 Nucleoside-diphosphate-sugar epimerase [Actinopolyspora xinjiangensis]
MLLSIACEVPVPLRVFVAGATGVVGRHLLPMLAERGHHVTALVNGEPRFSSGADTLMSADLFDFPGLRHALRAAAPDTVLQLSGLDGVDTEEALWHTARLRDQGTRNLLAAATEVGVRRVVVRSSATAYAPKGHEVADEQADLFTTAPGSWGEACRAVEEMERVLLQEPDVEGVALRFGELYGADTPFAESGGVYRLVRGSALPLVDTGGGVTSFTHVEDAAAAVLEALHDVEPAAYNVVDNEPAESGEWLPAYARMIGGPEPVSLTLEQANQQLDWATVHRLTEQRGASNFRFREVSGWRPRWPSWREGLANLFGFWPV